MSIPEYHHHVGVPFIIAGQAGGAMNTGRRIQYATEAAAPGEPLANVQLALLHKLGVPVQSFGAYGKRAAPQI